MNTLNYDSSPFLQQHLDQQLEDEILEILQTSKHLRFSLSQLARSYGVQFEVVEQLANHLARKYLKRDIEQMEFNLLIRQIEHLETKVHDPGLREFKLQQLAKSYKRTPRQLMDVYTKALVQQSQVDPMNVVEFRTQHSQEVDWLIQGWLPKGTTMLLHAEGGVGKTLFVYEILEAVAQGKPWNGYATAQGSVLLVQSDEPSLVTAERLDIRGVRDDDPVYILPEWQIEAMPMLERWVEANKPSLVIVDSLTAINRNCIYSENDTEYARPILQLAAMANKHGCTVIVIHHSNAEGNSRGTRATFNSVSEVWALSNVDFKERLLRVQKTRLGRPPGRYKFLFDDDDFSFRYLGEEGEEGDDILTQEERIRLWLADDSQRGTCYAPVEVSESLGIGREATRRALRELWAKGLIRRMKRTGSGYYIYYVPKNASIARSECSETMPESKHSDQPIGKAIGNEAPIALLNDLNSSSEESFSPQAIENEGGTPALFQKNKEVSPLPDRFSSELEKQQALEGEQVKRSEPIAKRSNENPIALVDDRRNTSSQVSTDCEALVGGYWVPGKYVRDIGMKFYSATRKLELVRRVTTKAGNIDVFDPDFRWQE